MIRNGTLFDVERQVVIGRKVLYAGSFLERLVGLLGRTNVPSDEGIWFPQTSSIHTLFMSSPIDVIFLNADNAITAIHKNVAAWKFLFGPSGTTTVVELGPKSSASALSVGGILRFDE